MEYTTTDSSAFHLNILADVAMEYTTDSGGGEMESQNGDVVIGPQPDPSITTQDADMEEDDARSEATFKFSVPQLSKLKVR